MPGQTAPRIGLGNAGVRVDACRALAAPALEVETPLVPGDCAVVTSSGWTPGVDVTLQLTDAEGNPVGEPVVVAADAEGALPADTCVTIPEGTAPGDYTVVAADPDGNAAEAVVTVYDPALEVQTPVLPQDCAAITSSGWLPGAAVSLQLTDADGKPVGDPVAATADENGSLPTDTCVPIPEGTAPGDYTVIGTDDNGNTAEGPVTVAAPGTPVLDASSPAPAGTDITVASGGWDPETDVTLQLADADGNAVGDPVVVTTDPNGDVPADTVVPVPADAPPGDYTLTATDPDGTSAEDVVEVYAPTLEATTPVAAGSCTTVTSGGWIGGSTVTLQLVDGAGAPVGAAAEVAADADGDVPADTCVTVPEGTAPGDYSVVGSDANGAEVSAPVEVSEVVLTPTLEASSPVPAGGESELTSGGWLPESVVSFQLHAADMTAVGDPVEVTTDADGGVPAGTVVPVPADAVAGEYTVVGTDADGNDAAAPVAVYAPTLEASSPVPAGGESAITSTGWLPESEVTLQLTDADGNPVGDPITVTTDANGDVPADTVIPVPTDLAPGAYTVVATDENGAELAAPLEIEEAAALAPVLEASSPVPAGGESEVTSGGWAAESEVTLQLLDGDDVALGDPVVVTTDADGDVPAGTVVPIPADAAAGDGYAVSAADGEGNTVSAAVEVYAPTLVASSPVLAGGATAITSGGWLPASEVTLQLVDGDGAPVGEPVTVTADADGDVPAGVVVAVPDDAVPGDYTVVASDETGAEVEAPLTVALASALPLFIAIQSPVAAGEEAAVTDSAGFTPGASVSLRMLAASGEEVVEPVTVTADADGQLPEGTSLAVPLAAEAGVYDVVAEDAGGEQFATALAVYAPTFDVTSPVPAGGDAGITSGGWLPDSQVTITVTDPAGAAVGDPIVVTTAGDGNLPAGTVISFAVDAAQGTYVVTATDAEGAARSDEVLVTASLIGADCSDPSMTLTPAVAAPGDRVTARGTGFAAGTVASVQLFDAEGDAVLRVPVLVTVGADCGFEVDVTVPVATEPGDYTVVVEDGDGGAAEGALRVVASRGAWGLASTGGALGPVAPVGMLLLGAGAALVIARRKEAIAKD
ncbi:hypothetical protein [Microbacterium sp. NPDC096154]|uniref:hypothetical protein n=1 Tax=Microbacterium sp. NPDC096154 TaxID=3155549 RepID=UPI00331C2BA9